LFELQYSNIKKVLNNPVYNTSLMKISDPKSFITINIHLWLGRKMG